MIENLKVEIRIPKEVRGPKSEAIQLAVAASSVRCTRFSVPAEFQDDPDDNGHFRASVFGLLLAALSRRRSGSVFGIRISGLSRWLHRS